MLKKLPKIILTSLISFLLLTTPVFAADFALTSIGTLDVSSGVYSQMWYTGNQPTFSGTGTSGETVTIVVDGTSYSTTVNTSEQWSWTPPAALTDGDHTLSFASGSETIALTLTTGSTVPTGTTATDTSTTSASPSALPETGIITPTLLVVVAGLGLISFPIWNKWAFAKS